MTGVHRFLLRMPEPLFTRLQIQAKRHGSSVNQEILRQIDSQVGERAQAESLETLIDELDAQIAVLAERRRTLQAERVRVRRRLRREATED